MSCAVVEKKSFVEDDPRLCGGRRGAVFLENAQEVLLFLVGLEAAVTELGSRIDQGQPDLLKCVEYKIIIIRSLSFFFITILILESASIEVVRAPGPPHTCSVAVLLVCGRRDLRMLRTRFLMPMQEPLSMTKSCFTIP